ncbi:uncharacterized protein LOC129775188 isoform X2 [Toxorhynchites rutilus septentrionalis]|uniref:uncharacterized protein LOC129775188 isoform X2 n=1 Tax=Toxorhynchites rutilus septentrionalis TaxID=329112 RepID=UPI0024799BE5|nr:uncharacterized protein LOC129775188 isoform X2 [Toxorhynchites rutilus septentrionalis]
MYSDKQRRSAFCDSGGGDKEKYVPYFIPRQPYRTYQSSAVPLASSSPFVKSSPPPQEDSFYANARETDVGICFSMSNVDLNSDYALLPSSYLARASSSAFGESYNDVSPYQNLPVPSHMQAKYHPIQTSVGRPIDPTLSSDSYQRLSRKPSSQRTYYFAHPKIPVQIYSNRSYSCLPTSPSSSSASAAVTYGQQLNNYYDAYRPPRVVSDQPRNAQQRTLTENPYYDLCLASWQSSKQKPQSHGVVSPTPSDGLIDVEVLSEQHELSPPEDDDPPKDLSMRKREKRCVDLEQEGAKNNVDVTCGNFPAEEPWSIDGAMEVDDECSRRTAAPKKKWIRHYMKDEPLVNGHSTAPSLVVISASSGSSSSNSSNSIIINSSHQKHHPASSLTIDLSTKSGSTGGLHLPSTPPSSVCSSTSSTLTISPVDDSQSSLNLSSGSSGYITNHSANSSSSLNLSGSNSGSSPLPITINGSVIASSHGSNSSPLPHDLVIVQQQQQQQQQQNSHLAQSGQTHGLTSTATLLNHIPTGGRRRTTSSTSNGVGTREVHNKLEKNRRAHLKECFEQLKKQLILQPDEKKTSNLSILHAAIRYIQLLKRKEREYEHEMERLAKEKIAAQNRILLLKRELSQWGDVDFTRLAPDTPDSTIPGSSSSSNNTINCVQSDRDLLNNPPAGVVPGRNGIRYSSSSSLSSVATNASIGNLPLQTTISPVMIAASSPSRASPPSSANRNTSSPAITGMQMPLSLTTKGSSAIVTETHNSTASPLKLTTSANLPNGLNFSVSGCGFNGISNGSSNGGSNCSTPNSTTSGSTATIGNGIGGAPLPLIVSANNLTSLSQSQLFTPVTATILTTGGGTAIQTLPLNLNVASSVTNNHHHSSSSSIASITNGVSANGSALQIIGTTANGVIGSTAGKELINGTTLPKNGLRTDSNKIEIIATQSTGGSSLDPPATKVIKLVNGNTIVGLTSVDKDKMMLSQVVQQGGLMVSPIQLLTSTQGLRVIQQAPNGLATIELSTPANVQPQASQAQRITGGNNNISSSNLSHLTSQSSSQSILSGSHQHLQNHHSHQHHHHPQQVTGAQLHKLLLSSNTQNGMSLNGTNGSSIVSSSTGGYINGSTTATAVVSTTTITPEMARLPGGAELNILPAGTNGATALPLYRTTGQPGKLAFVNAIPGSNGLTLKGTDCVTTGTGRTAVHVVTPIQTNASQLSGLTPVVVSRYDHQDATTLPGLFTTASGQPQTVQLGKVGALVSRN